MTAGQLATSMPSKPKPTTTIVGGKRPGAGRKTDAERTEAGYINYNEARAQREHWNAQIAEMEARKMVGDLIEAAEVSTAVQRLHVNFRAKALTIPTKTAPLLVGMESLAEIEAILTAAVHEALQELSGVRGA